jgi:thiol-disulfide isomerase/thioredoxin
MIAGLRPFLLAAAVLLAACAHAPPPAPVNLTLARADTGKPYALSERRGEATVLYFFTTWCVLCQAMERDVAEAAIRGEKEGIEVVGIALDREGRKLVGPYVAATQPPYPVLLGGEAVAEGRSQLGGIPEVPAIMILDAEGRPRSVFTGLLDADALLEHARSAAGH